MANQTVTTSQTLASAIAGGLNNGENLTINSGAIITADVSPTVLIGQVSINVGNYFWDGANAVNPIIACGEESEEINVNGAGIFETSLGWYIFAGTSSGLSGYTLDVSNYFSDDPNSNITADIFCGMWVETGRRIDYDTDSGVAPVVGDWLFKSTDHDVFGRIHSVGVGFVVLEALTGSLADNDAIELHTIQDNNGPDYQKSWNAQVNNALGDILELDVWTKWANTHQNNADRTGDVGNGMDGFVFYNARGTNNVIFGNGTAGRIPPNGCRFKMPMVHFCSSTVAQYALGNTTAPVGTGIPYNIETILGGDVILRGVSIGSAVFGDASAGSFTAESVACHTVLGSAVCGSRVSLTDCMVIGSIFSSTSSARRYPFELSDLSLGADLVDCAVYNLLPTQAETGLMAAITSRDINMTRCISVGVSANEENSWSKVDGITLYDYICYNLAPEFLTCFNIDARLIKLRGKVGTGSSSTKSMITFNTASKDVYIAGVEVLGGEAFTGNLFSVVDSGNIKVRGLHFIDDKLSTGGVGTTVCRTTGLSPNVDFARIWVDGNTAAAYTGTSVSSDVTLSNVSGTYNEEIEPRGLNISLKGVHGGAGNLGAATGIETDYTGNFGSNSSCVMRSDTAGVIALHFMPASTANPFLNVVGPPVFSKDGDFDIANLDSFTIETPIYYAITSFTGQFTSSRGSGSISDGTDEWGGNLTIEMQYDDGTGYNGTWLDVKTPADLTGIPDLSTGARFKVRITGTGNRTNNNGLMIHFATSIAAQKANLYPIDQFEATLTLTELKVGSDVVILVAGTSTVLASIDQVATTTYSYTYSTAQAIDYGVIKAGYITLYSYGYQLAVTDANLPITQLIDRTYQ